MVYKDDQFIGLIGQNKQGKILVRGIDKNAEIILKALQTPIKVDLADEIGDLVLSQSRVLLVEDPDWIVYMEYGLPFDFYVTTTRPTSENSFKAFDLSLVKE